MYSLSAKHAASSLCHDMMFDWDGVSAEMGVLIIARVAMILPCKSSSCSVVIAPMTGGETQAGGPRESE